MSRSSRTRIAAPSHFFGLALSSWRVLRRCMRTLYHLGRLVKLSQYRRCFRSVEPRLPRRIRCGASYNSRILAIHRRVGGTPPAPHPLRLLGGAPATATTPIAGVWDGGFSRRRRRGRPVAPLRLRAAPEADGFDVFSTSLSNPAKWVIVLVLLAIGSGRRRFFVGGRWGRGGGAARRFVSDQ
jgi:hypothetical protein